MMDEKGKKRMALGVIMFMFAFGALTIQGWQQRLFFVGVACIAGTILYYDLKGGKKNDGNKRISEYMD